MKRFVREETPTAVLLAVATLAAVAITRTGAPGIYLFATLFMAIAAVWRRLREPPEADEAPKERSGAGRNKGSR